MNEGSDLDEMDPSTSSTLEVLDAAEVVEYPQGRSQRPHKGGTLRGFQPYDSYVISCKNCVSHDCNGLRLIMPSAITMLQRISN